jgi:hypothetical protein
MTAIDYRGCERLLIIIAAMLIAILGYLLFRLGTKSHNEIGFKTSFITFIVSGTGPGLVFMIFSSFILMYALYYGGAVVEKPQIQELLKSR